MYVCVSLSLLWIHDIISGHWNIIAKNVLLITKTSILSIYIIVILVTSYYLKNTKLFLF